MWGMVYKERFFYYILDINSVQYYDMMKQCFI